MSNALKTVIKESLLVLGLYHKVNHIRFRNDERNISQEKFYAKVISKVIAYPSSKAKLNSISLDLVKSGGVPQNYETVTK